MEANTEKNLDWINFEIKNNSLDLLQNNKLEFSDNNSGYYVLGLNMIINQINNTETKLNKILIKLIKNDNNSEEIISSISNCSDSEIHINLISENQFDNKNGINIKILTNQDCKIEKSGVNFWVRKIN